MAQQPLAANAYRAHIRLTFGLSVSWGDVRVGGHLNAEPLVFNSQARLVHIYRPIEGMKGEGIHSLGYLTSNVIFDIHLTDQN